MQHRTRLGLFTAVVLGTAFTPALGQAATEQDGLAACAEAITNRLIEGQGAPIRYQIGDDSDALPRLIRGPSMVFHMQATDAKTDKLVARFDCVVSKAAKVRQLVPLPLKTIASKQI